MLFEKFMTIEQYLRKLSGLDKEVLLVDHNYVKAWNAHPDSNRTKPARLLFMKGLQRYPLLSDTSNVDCDVDIEACDEPLASPFDNSKIKVLASECEKSLKNNHLFKDREQDEEITLSSLSPSQRKLYQQVLNVLRQDELSKLCNSGSANESMKRRLSLDKAARQIRQIFGLIFWDKKEISWIHRTILNHCDVSTVASYVEVLQALKAKIPTLIERVLQSYAGAPVGDAVIQLMKKPWDPVQPVLNQNKPKKLPGNPIILICPSAPNQNAMNSHSPRLRFWHNSLGSMCKVMNIPVYSEDGKGSSTIEGCLDQMILSIRNKVAELKNHYPNRPLILLGWTIGALIACHIALQEPVDGVICIGFPLTGVNGSRGDLNDPLLDNKVPTLFIVGQNARMCSTDDVEDFRSRMRAETGLVIVGGCDDLLRMCPSKMKLENATQAVVDRCLLDEISDFLMSVVIKLPSTSAANTSTVLKVCTPIKEEPEVSEETWKPEEDGKRRRRKPREYSPELSPVRKRARHHIQRQSPSSSKARLSPSSSETSSSGSIINETAAASKPAKKLPEKRIGRPTAGTWRKRTPSKSESHSTPILPKKVLGVEETASPPKTSTPAEPKLPFSKNILPKKNDPVDVEKAFGKDSSFLPRPLTPPEPEDTVSAEETEKALAELEAMSNAAAASDSQVVKDATSATASTSVLGDGDRAFLPISDLESEPKKSDTVAAASTSDAQTAPATMSSIKNKAAAVSVSLSPSLQSILSQGKPLSASSFQTLKTAGGISLLATSTVTSSSPKSTIITVPSASAATILVSSPALRSQPGKMIQLLAKGNSTMAVKSAASSSGKESSEQQSCNLSLLSDVAGMTEPMNNAAKLADGAQQSAATLVKIAASDNRGSFQAIKCLKVIKTVKPLSPPTRFETAEEQVEKQLAIQSLNKSIGIESSQSNLVKEPGYSICYAKADGSIVSRSVTRPNFTSYVTVPSTMQGQNRGRGRARSVFNKQIRFGNM